MSPSARKLFKVVLYVGLWTVGLFVFVRNQVDEFLMHKTNYLVSNEPISLHDLPDLAICFKYGPNSRNPRKRLIYGQDFSILFKVFERDSQVCLQTRFFLFAQKYFQMMAKIFFKGAHGVEPWTSRSAVECSTTELYPLTYLQRLCNISSYKSQPNVYVKKSSGNYWSSSSKQ